MQKSTIQYLRYAFSRLFSKQFGNIVGSSLWISFIMSMAMSAVMVGGGVYLYSIIVIYDLWTFAFLLFLVFFLFVSSIIVLMRGWYAIVIPIRSIDDTRHMDIGSDAKIFWRYISIYISYVFWYSFIVLGIVVILPLLLIFFTAFDPRLGWFSAFLALAGILYGMTRMYLVWYHMLSEGSGTLKTFRKGIIITQGKAWRIFWKVLGFSLIVWIGSALIEGTLIEVISLLGFGDILDRGAQYIQIYRNNISALLASSYVLFSENSARISLFILVFGGLYSLSSVLSRAMFHIFYVRYYLDMREEHEVEHSFIMPILRKHEKDRH